ncbi:MAG: B12-binding domain-containing radical SAM protein [Clostridiaceae bacterium]|jgi:radical SAM superfamily enzyme YgiQ (UPF0313 family)|nr:B12-binding domain-containing radical SAM protein [Clostridiaceae bacterium]
MKILLIAINAKFEHENLAVWCLNAACLQADIRATVKQYSINDSMQRIWASIIEESPDVAAFSCYIWNRELVVKLISDLKKARPECTVIVGGPEVSYEDSENEFYSIGADFVIKGEGEEKFPLLLKALEEQNRIQAKEVLENAGACTKRGYTSPYVDAYLERIKGRIAYIESSRGCPYRCSYCLSSESTGLEYYPFEMIKEDIEKLVSAKARVIKFVDRSFNVNEEHSLKIWDFIREFENERVTFHFEINPDILTKRQIDSLLSMPVGLVQLEAGIQSVNPKTLKEVSRVMKVQTAVENLKTLMSKGNLHIHVDLIAGLPYEDMDSFRESFNTIYQIGAHHLQLGFLKLLHGTRIRREADLHGYKYRDYPPYEVIENKYITSAEILEIKGIEEALDRTLNSGRFTHTLKYLENYFTEPFNLYKGFSEFLKSRGRLYQPVAAAKLFEYLREYAFKIDGVNKLELDSFIALDYVCSIKNTVFPEFLNNSDVKALDVRILFEQIPEFVWKKEYRKRFMVLEGSFPDKKEGKITAVENRMIVDTENIDPITQRASAIPYSIFTQD